MESLPTQATHSKHEYCPDLYLCCWKLLGDDPSLFPLCRQILFVPWQGAALPSAQGLGAFNLQQPRWCCCHWEHREPKGSCLSGEMYSTHHKWPPPLLWKESLARIKAKGLLFSPLILGPCHQCQDLSAVSGICLGLVGILRGIHTHVSSLKHFLPLGLLIEFDPFIQQQQKRS